MSLLEYLGRVWSAFSQLLNVVLLFGEPNESISGRCYRQQWWAERLVNSVFFWQSRHCRGAHDADRKWAEDYALMPTRAPHEQPAKLWD